MNGKIMVALAGLGSRGKDTYAKAAKMHPDKMEIVAIADINPKTVEMVAEIINAEITEKCTDIGGIEFQITYADKSKEKKLYWVSGDYFAELFEMIKHIVPECEYVPAVLCSSVDE